MNWVHLWLDPKAENGGKTKNSSIAPPGNANKGRTRVNIPLGIEVKIREDGG